MRDNHCKYSLLISGSTWLLVEYLLETYYLCSKNFFSFFFYLNRYKYLSKTFLFEKYDDDEFKKKSKYIFQTG